MAGGALDGVTVVDVTSVGMGPMATQMLGDMGADVIKVEQRDGDVFRHVTPQRNHGMSHTYLNLNRNKRSVVLDLKSADGIGQLLSLLGKADVFVSNMRAPALRRLGLDAERLTETHPRLIHCGCYGYSERGPYGGRAAVDDTIHLMTRYRHEFEKRGYYMEALMAALEDVGRALIITSVTLACGFLVLTLSILDMTAMQGILLSTTVVVALIADFLLMPALILTLQPFGPERVRADALRDAA